MRILSRRRRFATTVVAATMISVWSHAFAADPTGVGVGEPCRRHECSNDYLSTVEPTSEPTFGDEELAWTPVVGWRTKSCTDDPSVPCTTDENRRCYDVALWPEQIIVRRFCEETRWIPAAYRWVYEPPRTSMSPYDVSFPYVPRFGLRYDYVVRACEGDLCGEWAPKTPQGEQDWVEFRGVFYACLGVEQGLRCEQRCSPAAPKMFPQIPDCEILAAVYDAPPHAGAGEALLSASGERAPRPATPPADSRTVRRADVERKWYRSSGGGR